MIEVGAGLEVVPAERAGSGWHVIVEPSGRATAAVALDEPTARCRLGLTFLDGEAIVDVSIDPMAWAERLRQAARAAEQHPDGWLSATTHGLDRFGRDRGWWPEAATSDNDRTVSIACMAAWPLLRPSLAAGHPTEAVPRWATGLLSGPDLATAVRRRLAGRVDRQVVRLVGRRLSGPIAWWPLAIALALPRLDAGRTGTLLEHDDGCHRCSSEEFTLLRTVLGDAPPDRALRLVGAVDGPDGPRRLLRALDAWARTGQPLVPVPSTVASLEDAAAARLEQGPAALRQPPPAAPNPPPIQLARRPVPPEPSPPRALRQAHYPPSTPAVSVPMRFDHPTAWRRLHRRRTGEVQLVLPDGPDQLTTWSHLLHNCLQTYAAAITARRSLVLGIRIEGCLAGAVEVDPGRRRIVQLLGPRNRPLPLSVEVLVIDLLAEAGAISTRPG